MKSHRSNFGSVLVILLAVSFLLLPCLTQAMVIRGQVNKRNLSHQSLGVHSKQPRGFSAQATGTGKVSDHHVWRLCGLDAQPALYSNPAVRKETLITEGSLS